jgi:hypothetical protein
MSIIAHAAVFGLDRISDHKFVSKMPWLRGGFKGLVGAGSFALGAYKGYYSYGHQYGTGLAAMYGIAAISPHTGIPLLLLDTAKGLANDLYRTQQEKRVSSFSTGKTTDKFGTIQNMRQFSGQQMRKDHSASARVFGNEAFYLHK